MVELMIDCIDCGGRCHLLMPPPPDEPPEPGDLLRYRCEDCLDVWYLIVPEEDDEGA
jgi:hypothetical protein